MPQLSVSLPLCTALNNPGTCNAHTLRGTHNVENDGMERWRGRNLNDDDDSNLHLNGCVSSHCNMLHQRVLVKE